MVVEGLKCDLSTHDLAGEGRSLLATLLDPAAAKARPENLKSVSSAIVHDGPAVGLSTPLRDRARGLIGDARRRPEPALTPLRMGD
jgi:hypothetical protein